MARVHVRSWQETYRGLLSDAVLDAGDAEQRRERMWATVLAKAGSGGVEVAYVAEAGGTVVGIASSGPPRDPDASWDAELYVLYLLVTHHGTGTGASLLNAVLPPGPTASLWVADPNPRAQAFYVKHGFTPDGAAELYQGMREIRMLRGARPFRESSSTAIASHND